MNVSTIAKNWRAIQKSHIDINILYHLLRRTLLLSLAGEKIKHCKYLKCFRLLFCCQVKTKINSFIISLHNKWLCLCFKQEKKQKDLFIKGSCAVFFRKYNKKKLFDFLENLIWFFSEFKKWNCGGVSGEKRFKIYFNCYCCEKLTAFKLLNCAHSFFMSS